MSSKSLPERPPSARRRFPRYPLDIRVTMQLFRSGEVISLWGRTNEIGRDGIGVTLTGQLEVGEVVTMELNLPHSSRVIKIRALVRYRDGLRHGFEFLALAADQRKIVDQTCDLLSGE